METCLASGEEPVMRTTHPLSWGELLVALWAKWDETLNRWADWLRDAMLDWDPQPPRPPRLCEVPTPPPLCSEVFVEAMHGEVEDTLRQVAALLNDAAPDRPLNEDRLCDLFADLAHRAVARGKALRVQPVVPQRCQPSSWAERYRRMILEATMPSAG
jgi:hypothetical protein